MKQATRLYTGLVPVLVVYGLALAQPSDPPAGVVAMAVDGGQPRAAVPGLPPPLRTWDMGRTMAYWPADAGTWQALLGRLGHLPGVHSAAPS
jgi:hypothetical protein